MSLIEMSHRTPVFDDVISRAKASIAELLPITDTHESCSYRAVPRFNLQ